MAVSMSYFHASALPWHEQRIDDGAPCPISTARQPAGRLFGISISGPAQQPMDRNACSMRSTRKMARLVVCVCVAQ